jgi:hypothetical protein
MENKNFTTAILVEQTSPEVFKTLLNVRAWWSGLFDESFEGGSEKLGDEFSFLAGGGVHYTKQKLVELIPNKKVTWLVTEARLTFVDDIDEWEGTKISFELFEEGNKTKVVFTHIGLVPQFQCYDACSSAWTQYIQEQLYNLLSGKYEKSN